MDIVVLMDPPSTVIFDEDTTFALMLEAQERGHRLYHCLAHDVCSDAGRIGARVRPASLRRDPEAPMVLEQQQMRWLDDVDVVWVRKDPPFDSDYLWLTLMLDLIKDRTLVMNDPTAIRDANEKIFALHFPELMPPTLISSDKTQIREFVNRIGGAGVIKPIDGAGGAGVLLLRADDLNFNAICELATRQGKRMAMVQEFIPKVSEGDKRVLLLDGEPLGGILRVPQQGDLRSNIHVGGRVIQAELDENDQRIIASLREPLRQRGLYFVGIDVIAGKLTEINVTSPTGIQQMSRLNGVNISAQVIDWMESNVASHSRYQKTR